MSGHSKWSTIKRQKAAGDMKRGRLFSKFSRAISIAVKEGGGEDPAFNFRLRLEIDRAKNINMPKENINRAIEKGMGKGGQGLNLEKVVYEAYGPMGVAMLIEVVTDNKQRSVSDIKQAIDRAGGRLGEQGSVAYLFDRVGLILVPRQNLTEDQILEKAINAGAEDVITEEDGYVIYTPDKSLHQVKIALENAGVTIEESKQTYKPKTSLPLAATEMTKIEDLVEKLEDLEDTQEVYTNAVGQ